MAAATTSHEDQLTTRRKMVDDIARELRARAKNATEAKAVRLIETHISWVLLGPEVYKIKKPIRLPFVDYTSFEAREQACRAETRLNRRLAPRTYLGVVPIRKRPDGQHTLTSSGVIVDWAVRMRRLDDALQADRLLVEGKLRNEQVDALATGLSAFHADTPSTLRIARYGAPELIEHNVTDNFAVLRRAGEDIVSEDVLHEIEHWQLSFIRGHRELLEHRMIDGAVRDGHGDLRLEHIFFHRTPTSSNDFEVIDSVEFDERYRAADVCADIAFLAMDFERMGHVDLAERLVAKYARASNDFELYRLIDFYESYRACVRAKIALLNAIAHDRSDRTLADAARADARRYLLLAGSAPRRALLAPLLIAVAGGIASGKSALAEQLADELNAPIVDADRTRKHLLCLEPTGHQAANKNAWEGAYDPAFSEVVYGEVLRRADAVLASGRPVIIDASFRTKKARAAARQLALAHNVPFRVLECTAPAELRRARLRERDAAKSVSDATIEIFDAFLKGYEPISELCATEHLRIDTSQTIEDAVKAAKCAIETWNGLVR